MSSFARCRSCFFGTPTSTSNGLHRLAASFKLLTSNIRWLRWSCTLRYGCLRRNALSAWTVFPANRACLGSGTYFLMYSSSSVEACSAVVFDSRTAFVRPFSPWVLVHHSSFDRRSVSSTACERRNLYHLIHCLLRLMDYCSPSVFVQYIQVPICDDAEDFNNNIAIYIEPGHLWGVNMSHGREFSWLYIYLAVNPHQWMACD